MFTLSFVALVAVAGEPAPAWHNSFADGRQAALKSKKDLFIYFRPDDRLDETLRDDSIKALLRNYVCVKVPPDHKYQGKLYLDHPALSDMMGTPGIAVISFHDDNLPQYREVVSAHPFVSSHYGWVPALRTDELKIVLGLPAEATLTQRSMIYAVCVHPEKPRSVFSRLHPALRDHAERHSARQAATQHQHHANILGIGGNASEVVAESWGRFVGGESVLEASFSCVDAWRHSSGHWSAVAREHSYFCFDIAQGGNGTWYATGIFTD